MQNINNERLNAPRQRFAQRASVDTAQDSTKPIVREYIDPTDKETIISAAKKRDTRTRAQKPSTPPLLDSPLLSLSLGPGDLLHSSYDKAEHAYSSNPSLFFSCAAQSKQEVKAPKQMCLELELDTAQDNADTSARHTPTQPLAQGSKVRVLRQLKRKPASFTLDALELGSENDEVAQCVNTHLKSAIDETTEYFARAAATALRRVRPRPNALNPVEINTDVGFFATVSPLTPRQSVSEDAQEQFEPDWFSGVIL